ncbi:transcriptional regulator with XRE-family HTH domain [Actinoplanes lutulentus]|uniref:Transcriptional regulator with XRE-family HTH domain n=1 Tax=Actinoplanes lutulentus TaxID=1287878 RepID=A0A327ZJM6_9ACTN|nr:helix-turn-helix transcriptional regulator [Actinoplanes lutulentus]MBB2942854.1 transcriptional regulator with XRE-family HTH domain [Actinoplanes lutulentus]RAK38433.1 transcriptional regulator with XRE-family HTH domain [Actinoplanes lutulentus]
MTPRHTADPSIGSRIQARRLLRGWSIRYAASRAGISHSTWSRIERGLLAADNRFVLADLATALECSPAELAGAPVPASDRSAVAAHAAVHAIRQALIDLDLTIPPTPGGTAVTRAHREPSISRGEPGRPVAELARAVALLDSLRQACDYAGAARLTADLLRELRAATTGSERAPAMRLLCDVTFMASSVLRNLGHPADAWLAAERCRDAARATEDPVLLAYAAYARSCAATACGSFGSGLVLAAHALDDLEPHSSRTGVLEMRGSLQLQCAHASRGLKLLDDSRAWAIEAGELARRTGETTTMGLYFGPTNVGIWRIGIEADGGDPGRATEIARATNPAIVPAGFRQVFYYADTARALARLRGRDREAIRLLLIAERVAPQHIHTSAMAQETTRALLDRSRRAAGGPELRALAERLQLT